MQQIYIHMYSIRNNTVMLKDYKWQQHGFFSICHEKREEQNSQKIITKVLSDL